jgi:hypothetical protein
MNTETMQKLDDMLVLDAMASAALTPTLSATERTHLHHTRALCARICPSWEWTLDEPAGRIEAVRRDRATPHIVVLHLSPFTLRWNGALHGLARTSPAEQMPYVQGASAMEVLLQLLIELTAPMPSTHAPTKNSR